MKLHPQSYSRNRWLLTVCAMLVLAGVCAYYLALRSLRQDAALALISREGCTFRKIQPSLFPVLNTLNRERVLILFDQERAALQRGELRGTSQACLRKTLRQCGPIEELTIARGVVDSDWDKILASDIEVSRLTLRECEITSASLTTVCSIRHMRALSFIQCKMLESELIVLNAHDKLEEINLLSMKVSASDANALFMHPSITRSTISTWADLSQFDFAYLRSSHIAVLRLENMPIARHQIEVIMSSPNITELYIDRKPEGFEGLSANAKSRIHVNFGD